MIQSTRGWLLLLLSLMMAVSAGCKEEKKDTRTFRYEGPGGPVQVDVDVDD